MKYSHERTPRTLADCDFTVGYPIVQQPESYWEKIAGVLLACAIGIGFGLALIAWWLE